MIWSASFGITLPPLPSAWEAATVPAWISGTHYHNGDFVKSYEPLSVPSSPPVFNVVAGKVYSPNSFVTHGGSVYYQSAAQGTPSGTFSGSAWVLCAPTAHWKGLWSSTATYNVDDVVVVVADPAPDPNIDPDITSPVAGKIWKATAPVTGTAPSNTGWTQLPSSGVNIRANAAFYWTATVEIPGVHDDNPPASSNDWWSNTYPVPFYYG
jgi:hypothetical protein